MNIQSHLETVITKLKIHIYAYLAQISLFLDQVKHFLDHSIQTRREFFLSFMERKLQFLSVRLKAFLYDMQQGLNQHQDLYFWGIVIFLLFCVIGVLLSSWRTLQQTKKSFLPHLSLLVPSKEKMISGISNFSKNLFENISFRSTLLLEKGLLALEHNFGDNSLLYEVEKFYNIFIRIGQQFLERVDYAGRMLEKALLAIKVIKKALQAGELLISHERKEADLKNVIPDSIRQEFERGEFEDYEQYLNFFPQQKKMVHTVASHWQAGNSASFLIIGKKGSGKSQFMQLFQAKYFSEAPCKEVLLVPSICKEDVLKQFYQDLSASNDFSSALDYLQNSERLIIMVDGLHYLFIRKNGGYDALRQLLELIEKTEEKHLWIVTIDENAFFFLKQIMPLADVFEFQLKMNTLNSKEVQKIILAKAQKHGFSLVPEITQEKLSFYKKKIKKGELQYGQVPKFILSQYFSSLVNNCENIFPALYYYFLRSIKYQNKNQLILDDPEWIDISFTEKMETIYYFILTSIFVHEMISSKELEDILQLSRSETNLYLALLSEKKLIQAKKIQGQEFYFINPVLVIPLSRMLKIKNFLYFI